MGVVTGWEGGGKSRILSFHFGNEEFGEIEGTGVRVPFNYVDFFLILLHDDDDDDDSIVLMTSVGILDYEIWIMIQQGSGTNFFAFKLTSYPFIMSWFSNTVIYVTMISGQGRRGILDFIIQA
ncbi:hypothetical protein AABB24_022305 [Solanum stoloniferum]|uniref:Uncharacterized protein n=1 Tax=Solanum stoloniferum TaxID=62892 RepID=A0ABD2SYT6_9SOLN